MTRILRWQPARGRTLERYTAIVDNVEIGEVMKMPVHGDATTWIVKIAGEQEPIRDHWFHDAQEAAAWAARHRPSPRSPEPAKQPLDGAVALHEGVQLFDRQAVLRSDTREAVHPVEIREGVRDIRRCLPHTIRGSRRTDIPVRPVR